MTVFIICLICLIYFGRSRGDVMRWEISRVSDTRGRSVSSMMAEDPGGAYFNLSFISFRFSLSLLVFETWQEPRSR